MFSFFPRCKFFNNLLIIAVMPIFIEKVAHWQTQRAQIKTSKMWSKTSSIIIFLLLEAARKKNSKTNKQRLKTFFRMNKQARGRKDSWSKLCQVAGGESFGAKFLLFFSKKILCNKKVLGEGAWGGFVYKLGYNVFDNEVLLSFAMIDCDRRSIKFW